ncbi:MAG: hypothetical protein WB284_07340, partial [Methanoregula sp.]|uniref:hypothetical protein n=1 Tax=Methanoregula sp. TaxID=2052170 RepID=UPI003C581BDD
SRNRRPIPARTFQKMFCEVTGLSGKKQVRLPDSCKKFVKVVRLSLKKFTKVTGLFKKSSPTLSIFPEKIW